MYDAMIDLETLNTTSDAAIISLGAIIFDPFKPGLGASLYREIKPNLKKYSVDFDTLGWWMKQSTEVQGIFNSKDTTLLDIALQDLFYFYRSNACQRIWSNGASFDIPIVEYAYSREKLVCPWDYKSHRDVRTILRAAGVKVEHTGTQHNALDDAQAQALAVTKAYEILGIKQEG